MPANRERTWLRKPLAEVAAVGSGYAFKSSEFGDGGIPVIKIKNVRVGHVDLSGADCVDEKYLTIPERYHVLPGDVLISMTGSHISQPNSVVGRVARHSADHPECLLNQRVGKIVVKDSSKADLRFLYYALSEQETVRAIAMNAHGAANQANVSPAQIESVEIPLPPFPIQRRIAEILSAYDELIENSQRRIKILESMARALYREWFVHFRFPGHESVPRVPSPLGEIPQGWEVKKLGHISSYISRGITPRYDEGGDSVVINQKCVRDQRLSLEPARRQSKAIPAKKHLCFGDVLINSTGVGTLGRVAQVYESLEKCTVDTHVTIARAACDTDLDFYGCCLLSLQESFERLGTGATGQTELARAAIADSELVMPPPNLQSQFGAAARGMRSAAVAYEKKIHNLRLTRDLLITRLLAGQIDMEEA